jgi:hypothetical protein
MHKPISSLLLALSLASCSGPSTNTPWQQAAISNYLQQTLATTATYQPVRWGPVTTWRMDTIAKVDLPMTQQRLLDAMAVVRHDSAGYALVERTAAQFGTPAADVALVKQRYLASARDRDSCRAQLRQLIATQGDTTVAFYRLAHTYTFKNEQGQQEVDSVQFNVGKQGVIVPLDFVRISPPTPEIDMQEAPLAPPVLKRN